MNKQKGFVSIIVAAVLMILLSLITIGFSRLMQREQRQALDRQLSTQAFYAAETAVNDVRSNLEAGTLPAGDKTTCDVSGIWNNGIIDTGTPEISYTCLQYDTSPLDLLFTDTVNTVSSKVFPVEANSDIASIKFEWTGEGGSRLIDATYNSCAVGTVPLPASFSAGSIPLLRLDLIKAPIGALDRDTLINNTASLYLYPKGCGTNTIDFTTAIGSNSGQVIEVDCDPDCYIDITGLSGSARYYARVKSVYNNVGSLRVTAVNSATAPLELKNAQTLVDATGKANDVLRRIEVRIPNSPNYRWPEAVAETTEGLCKLLTVAPPDTVTGSDCY